ncbi:MAG: energy transducer TonB, partial [Bacteroidales bacterium]|nr:energy transducer TonB [Bacteroidales bacterium]
TSITNLYDAGYDEPPVFPGSEEALMRFIETNKNYPQAARDRNIKGTIVVRFRIDETGKVTNSSIFSGVDPLLDAEALRVVNSMPQWQPAKRKDKPVKVFYTLEIPFN